MKKSQSRTSPRKRGAQRGNHNALTHGFYSTLFKDRERQLLSSVPLTDLSSEIGLIRIVSKRFLETLAAFKEPLDFDTQLSALRAINLSAHSIATLLRAHALATAADADPLAAAEALALQAAAAEATAATEATSGPDAPPFVSI